MATSSFLGLTTFWKRLAFSNFDDWILGTVLKVSVFGIILVRIFPHSEWITPNTDTFYAVGSLILSKNRQESGYDVKLLSTGIPTGLFFNLKLQRYQFFLEPKFHSSCSRVFLNSEYLDSYFPICSSHLLDVFYSISIRSVNLWDHCNSFAFL